MTGGTERPRYQTLVVSQPSSTWPVRPRGVKHVYTGAGSGRDRVESELLVVRQAHATQADPKLRTVKPGHRIN
jgi:hypothetical protein